MKVFIYKLVLLGAFFLLIADSVFASGVTTRPFMDGIQMASGVTTIFQEDIASAAREDDNSNQYSHVSFVEVLDQGDTVVFLLGNKRYIMSVALLEEVNPDLLDILEQQARHL